MSVLKNKRSESKVEFKDKFNDFYIYSVRKLEGINKRYQKDTTDQIIRLLNDAKENVAFLYLGILHQKITDKEKRKYANKIIKNILETRPIILACFNLFCYEYKKQCIWANYLDIAIEYIFKVGGFDMRYKKYEMPVIDYEQSKKVVYIQKMRAFQKNLYSQIVSSPKYFHDSNGAIILNCINNAVFYAMKANKKIPKNRDEYILRTKMLNEVLMYLEAMNAPLVALFSLRDYSGRNINNISKAHSEVIRLIQGVINSDKTRFASLS